MYVILVSVPCLPGVLSVTQKEHSTYITIPILTIIGKENMYAVSYLNTVLMSLLPFKNNSVQGNNDGITEQSSLINVLVLQDLGILMMCHMSVYTYQPWLVWMRAATWRF